MATLYEYYILPGNSFDSIRGNLWKGQTFTPSVDHRVTSVKIKARRYGFPGIITVSIKATLDGHPTGPDLCPAGTTNGNTLTDASPGEWREISLGDGAILSAGQKYAIVVRALAGDGSNNLQWRLDSTNPTYVGGCKEYSSDGGTTWHSYDGIEHSPSSDELFEEWGEPAITTPTVSTDPATSVRGTTATLNGTLDDDGREACACGFEYGQTTDYGTETDTESKTTDETFSQEVRNLKGRTVYHFRAIATNSAGTSYGSDQTFTTGAQGNPNIDQLIYQHVERMER